MLKNFLIELIKNEKGNKIKLYFCKKINSEIYNSNLKNESLEKIHNFLKNFEYRKDKIREYYNEDLVYHMNLDDNTSIAYQHQLIDTKFIESKNDILLSLLQYDHISNIDFPCRKEYHQVINKEITIYKINDFLNVELSSGTLVIIIKKDMLFLKKIDSMIELILNIGTLIDLKIN